MSEKKVIAFIVEGPSDEAALGTIMKDYFSNSEVRFVVVHGDITVRDYVSMDTIISKIYGQIEVIKSRYRYKQEDFIKILHIADTDGVFIPKKDVRAADTGAVQYYDTHIETKHVDAILERNRKKAEILYKLRKTPKVNAIPYRIYFNSCNLEHVLYGELRDFSDEEKQILSDDFADRYDGKVDDFIEFISTPELAAPGTYQETWDYIEKDRKSLQRHTNMHLIFEQAGKNGC